MSCKTPAAFVAALASLAVIAPAASAAVTTAPLTVATSGDNATFTIAAPAQSPDMIALLIANADSGSSSFAYTMVQGVGEGAVATKASTDACQVVNGTSVTLVKLPETQFSETSGFTVSVPTSILPASFDAKAVYVDDFDTDICSADADNIGVATTMAGATRFPAPVVAPVVAPVPTPAPVVTPAPAKPVADPDKDGIANDW